MVRTKEERDGTTNLTRTTSYGEHLDVIRVLCDLWICLKGKLDVYGSTLWSWGR